MQPTEEQIKEKSKMEIDDFNKQLKIILTDNMQAYEAKVAEIIALFRQAGYVRVADMQIAPILYGIGADAQERIRYSYLNENWRKVEL